MKNLNRISVAVQAMISVKTRILILIAFFVAVSAGTVLARKAFIIEDGAYAYVSSLKKRTGDADLIAASLSDSSVTGACT